jgi:hypothetical protein
MARPSAERSVSIMDINEILLTAQGLAQGLSFITGLAAKLQQENRDPTPEEIAQARSHQQTAEDRWQSLLPK